MFELFQIEGKGRQSIVSIPVAYAPVSDGLTRVVQVPWRALPVWVRLPDVFQHHVKDLFDENSDSVADVFWLTPPDTVPEQEEALCELERLEPAPQVASLDQVVPHLVA